MTPARKEQLRIRVTDRHMDGNRIRPAVALELLDALDERDARITALETCLIETRGNFESAPTQIAELGRGATSHDHRLDEVAAEAKEIRAAAHEVIANLEHAIAPLRRALRDDVRKVGAMGDTAYFEITTDPTCAYKSFDCAACAVADDEGCAPPHAEVA